MPFVEVKKKFIDASAGGEDVEVAICTLPARSILVDIVVYVEEGFDGDDTAGINVGIEGEIDRYMNTTPNTTGETQAYSSNADYRNEETPIILTWTNKNTVGDPTAGKLRAHVLFVRT